MGKDSELKGFFGRFKKNNQDRRREENKSKPPVAMEKEPTSPKAVREASLPAEPEKKNRGFFQRLKAGLKKTHDVLVTPG